MPNALENPGAPPLCSCSTFPACSHFVSSYRNHHKRKNREYCTTTSSPRAIPIFPAFLLKRSIKQSNPHGLLFDAPMGSRSLGYVRSYLCLVSHHPLQCLKVDSHIGVQGHIVGQLFALACKLRTAAGFDRTRFAFKDQIIGVKVD